MKGKRIIAIIALLALSCGLIYGLSLYITNLQKPVELVQVAVAKNDVSEGSFLTTDDYEYVLIPASEYIPSYVTMAKKQTVNTDGSYSETTYDSLKGKEVSQRIYEGERIVKGRINFSAENLLEENEYNDSKYKRYTYSGAGLENFAGLLKSGDRIDIWIQYIVTNTEKNGKTDRIIVSDKIFSEILVSKVLDSSGNEVTASTGAATVLELMMTEEQIQSFIAWRAVGNVTLVKVSNLNESGKDTVTRKKLSIKELTDSVVSSPEGDSILLNVNVIENSGADYDIELVENASKS